jgi:hypothetical protein
VLPSGCVFDFFRIAPPLQESTLANDACETLFAPKGEAAQWPTTNTKRNAGSLYRNIPSLEQLSIFRMQYNPFQRTARLRVDWIHSGNLLFHQALKVQRNFRQSECSTIREDVRTRFWRLHSVPAGPHPNPGRYAAAAVDWRPDVCQPRKRADTSSETV